MFTLTLCTLFVNQVLVARPVHLTEDLASTPTVLNQPGFVLALGMLMLVLAIRLGLRTLAPVIVLLRVIIVAAVAAALLGAAIGLIALALMLR